MKIVYWSDYACPYCYIGEKRLEKVLKELEIKDITELKMKSFEMNPNASTKVESRTDERFAKKYGLSLEKARNKIDEITKLGKIEGIDIKYADTLYVNTFNAHRLTKLVESKGKKEDIEKVENLLFDAYFTKNLVLTDRSVLINIGEQAGLNKEEINRMLDSNEFTEEVRRDEREAYRKGIHGVPYFVINDKYVIPGAASKEDLKELLQDVIDEQLQREGAVMACGINGCN